RKRGRPSGRSNRRALYRKCAGGAGLPSAVAAAVEVTASGYLAAALREPCPPLWVGMVKPHAHAKPWAWHPILTDLGATLRAPCSPLGWHGLFPPAASPPAPAFPSDSSGRAGGRETCRAGRCSSVSQRTDRRGPAKSPPSTASRSKTSCVAPAAVPSRAGR